MRTVGLLLSTLTFMLAQSPKTKTAPVTETLHGVTITDPYRWIEDQNSPETRAWIDAQMGYTQSALAKVPQRERIRKRLGELMKIDKHIAPSAPSGLHLSTHRSA